MLPVGQWLVIVVSVSAGQTAHALTPDEVHPEYGTVAIDPTGPVVVRSVGTWTVTYTVGAKGFAPGDILRVGYSHLISDWGTPQVTDPTGANYLGIYASKPIAPSNASTADGAMRVRVSVRWGHSNVKEMIRWDGRLRLSAGRIVSAKDVGFHHEQVDKLVSQTETTVEWLSETGGGQDGVDLVLDVTKDAVLSIDTKQGSCLLALDQLLAKGTLPFLRRGLSVSVERPVRFFRGSSHDRYVSITNEGETLAKGDTVAVVFGDTSGGGPGTVVQSYEEAAYRFEVSVKPKASRKFFQVGVPTLDLIGAEAKQLAVFAPSVVGVGETFDVAVKAEDEYFNRASDYTGAVALEWDMGSGSVPASHAFSIEVHGVYVFRGVRADRAGTVYLQARQTQGLGDVLPGLSNPIRVKEQPTRRVYWGELHGHTMLSDGRNTADSYYRMARDVARLDFAAMTDHDIQNKYGLDYMWQEAKRAAKQYNDEPNFVTFLAWEWSGPSPAGGDHNTFFLQDDQPLFPARPVTALWQSLSQLKGVDSMTIPHVGGRIGNWDFHDDRFQRVGEIASDHGIFEWFLQDALSRGHKVGIVAGSDDHQGHPGKSPQGVYWNTRGGLAAVYADERTRPSIWDGLYARRCYGSTLARILLDVRMGEHAMGESFISKETPPMQVYVAGTAPLLQIDVLRNNERVYTHNVGCRTNGAGSRRWLRVLWTQGTGGAPGIHPGTLGVTDGKLLSAEPLHFESYREGIRSRTDAELKWDFTSRRGDIDGVLVGIEGSESTRLRVALGSARNAKHEFTLADIRTASGQTSTTVGSLPVTVTEVNPEAPRVTEFTYQDSDPPAAKTTYYYVRVVQIDGHMAWSSPIWVDALDDA